MGQQIESVCYMLCTLNISQQLQTERVGEIALTKKKIKYPLRPPPHPWHSSLFRNITTSLVTLRMPAKVGSGCEIQIKQDGLVKILVIVTSN